MINRNIHQVSTFPSVANFLETDTVPAGISTIYSGGLPIDLLVSPGKSDTTIFFFHGAIERHFTLPVLSGLGIAGGLNANRVFVSDPSLALDDDLMLAWYAGNCHQPDLQESLVSIFEKILLSLGSNRTVFFGGSGGGFASLFFASHFENSLAVVFNPQTSIANYSERAVRDFAEKSFQVHEGLKDPLSRLPTEVSVDLCEIYSQAVNTKILYMQNSEDTSHIQFHLTPFLESLHAETGFLLMKEPWQEGHFPPPKELLTKVLNLAAESDDWGNDSFIGIGFSKNPSAT